MYRKKLMARAARKRFFDIKEEEEEKKVCTPHLIPPVVGRIRRRWLLPRRIPRVASGAHGGVVVQALPRRAAGPLGVPLALRLRRRRRCRRLLLPGPQRRGTGVGRAGRGRMGGFARVSACRVPEGWELRPSARAFARGEVRLGQVLVGLRWEKKGLRGDYFLCGV